MFPKMYIHSVGEDWPHLHEVPGIDAYWNRALMMRGGTCVVHARQSDPNLQLLLQDYSSVGVGPDKVVFIAPKTGSFYQDILDSRNARKEIDAHIRKGGKLDLFCSSPAAGGFVRELGVNGQEHTVNPTLESYRLWADKRELRRMLGERGFKNLFPGHGMATTLEDLQKWTEHFNCNGAEGTMFKRGDGASSEAIETRRKGMCPSEEFMEKYWDEKHGLIVEAAYEHHPFSVSFNLTNEGVFPVNCSLQWMGVKGVLGNRITLTQLLEQDMTHRGNLCGPTDQDLGPVSRRVITGMASALHPAMLVAQQAGLRGIVCADCIHVRDELSYLVEFNPRTSHSGYVRGVREAVSAHMGQEMFVLAANVTGVNKNLETYMDARERLPNLMQAGMTSGTLMFHTPLLTLGKVGVIAIGTTYEGAVEAFQEAEQALKAA